jgi:hypothetical protein
MPIKKQLKVTPKGMPDADKIMNPKMRRKYDAADADKMPVYGDDLNEKGKPKFKTPVLGWVQPKAKTGKL